MGLEFTQKEFQFLQSITNEMYQTAALRTGPMSDMIISIRTQFLSFGVVNLTDAETRFMLFALNDIFVTSQSPIVQSQLGLTMKLQSPANLAESPTKVTSSISQTNTSTNDQIQGSYSTERVLMQSCMKKLGLVASPLYIPLKEGPTGDPFGVSPGLPNVNPDDRIM